MAENKDKDIVMKCRHMEKVYPGTKALDDVDFNIYRGKVNVLIGENGAGKSTLMKQIAGIEQPSSGKMYLDGEEVSFKNTTEARAKGVGIIHQELSLFPNLNVYQNIFMNNEQKKGVVVNNEIHKQKTKEVLERLEYPIDPEAKVGDLRVGQQQMIEIARNLIQDDLKILIMDEPTSSLSQSEVQVLFKIMRELNAQGISIVYISHRLEEIMEIGDHVTILRDGKYVDDAAVKDIDVPWIVQKMTGSNKSYPKKERDIDWEKQDTVLEVKDLCLPKKGGGWLLDHVSFKLKRGEILGIYGLMGAGRTEVFECLMGLHPEHTGEVYVDGKKIKIKNIAEQIKNGFALVPEDRQAEGLVQTLDIEKNISLSGGNTFSSIKGQEALGNVGIMQFDSRVFAVGGFPGIPIAAILFLILAVIAAFVLKKTPFGWHILAIGGNEKAARLSGIKVEKNIILVYAISGACSALIGLVTMAQIAASHPNTGDTWEMNAIAAVVLGGTSMAGGVGTIGGTVIGAFVIGIINDGMTMCGVSEFWQKVIKGLVIILAVLIDQFQRNLQAKMALQARNENK